MSLRPYQHDMLLHIIRTPRCAVWASMGSGKTRAVLEAISMLEVLEPVMPVLVVAPLRVAKSTWPAEIAKWPTLDHLTCQFIGGSTKERLQSVKVQADVFTTNYENLPWLVDHFKDAWPFKMVVLDESTRFKSFRLRQGSMRARSFAKVAFKHVKRIVLLTGTPAPQGIVDLWGQQWMVDQGERLGKSFDAFKSRWFQSIQVGASRFATKLQPLPHAQKEIEDILKDVCLTIDVADHLDIGEPVVNVIELDLPPAAMSAYREMEKEMFTILQDTEIEVFNAAARTMKCLQMCNGALYHPENPDEYMEVHREKLDALASIVEESSGAPVLVAYHFRSDLERLCKAFPQGRVLDKDPSTIDEWNAGTIPLLFAHPQSAGHGLNLAQGGNILVFFGLNWSLEEHLQIIERVGPTRQAQLGTGRACFIHYLVAKGTVDELVLERLRSKKSVQDILLEAMKRRTA
jgi:SNF2 family DNA or RNA helicase